MSTGKKFKKEILTEGLYVTGDGNGGRQVSFVPKKRIKHWADQHAEMVKAGIRVPAPELHAEDEDPNKYITEAGSKSNYGFWEQLSLGEKVDEDGTVLATLEGVLDVPLESDAERIGNTVRETSIYAKDKFVDGTGKVWEDVLVHISPCVKPIEPGQKNFTPLETNDLAIAMSMSHRLPVQMSAMGSISELMEDDAAPSDDLRTMLESVAGISIPPNISMDQLEQSLLAALRQKQLSEKHGEGGSVTKPPKDSVISQVPIVMSSNTNQGAKKSAPQSSVPVTPAPEGGKGEVIPPDTIAMSQLESQNKGLLEVITSGKKESLMARLNGLKQRGIVNTKERFDELAGEINGITSMSFDDQHKPVASKVEIEIGALEKVSIPMPANAPTIAMSEIDDNGNYVIQNNPLPSSPSGQVTPDRANDIVNGLFGTTNKN